MTRRVVIAEDEAIIRLDLKEILLDEGYDVVGETGRGDEAVELVRDHQPDLVAPRGVNERDHGAAGEAPMAATCSTSTTK